MNIFELGYKVFNRRNDIQRVVQLVQPTLNSYNNTPELIPTVQKAMKLAKPIVDEYARAEKELVPLVTSLINDLFPPFMAKALPKPVGGYNVKWLQSSLNKLGAKLKVDGDYGPLTKEAVWDYQQDLVDKKVPGWDKDDVDGWAGLKTCSAIYNDLIR